MVFKHPSHIVKPQINKQHSADASDLRMDSVNIADENLHATQSKTGESPDPIEPIAVVGFSIRFPQDATTAAAFWTMLSERRSSMTEFPGSRINVDAFYHSDAGRHNSLSLRGGHFLAGDIGAFDAPFFSVSPLEASEMDPQQRLLLETAYRALENAGIPLEKASGTKTAVYTGCSGDDYKSLFHRDPDHQLQYAATGLAPSMLANRISWFFNLNGPSLNIDTACSSSLIALDSACQGLRDGQSNMALVGGCNLIFNPDQVIALSNLHLLSPDSKCYSFDHRANGYSRGEGFGFVVIKRLSDAIQAGDTIRAVIRATGANQDGKTPGISQPSEFAQANLMRETYAKAGLQTDTTRFFEAHGTGTPVGDPTEARAIKCVFAPENRQHDPLYIGAVKSNIGHLEGGSGIAGLVKTILVLEKGVIPPNAEFQSTSQDIDADAWKLKFPTEAIRWPGTGLRRASVNSFGFGGSNAHVIVDDACNYLGLRGIEANHCTAQPGEVFSDAPSSCAPSMPDLDGSLAGPVSEISQSPPQEKLLLWSAMDEGGLKRLSSVYSEHFQHLPDMEDRESYFQNLCYTLGERRSSLPWKAFTISTSMSDLQAKKLILSKPVRKTSNLQLVYIFTGQGAQWASMGRELLRYPVYKNSLMEAEQFFKELGSDWSLLDELKRDYEGSRINDVGFTQPSCTALQIALVDLLRSFKIYPSTVVGHSSGEIAAAYCVGGLSRESAWRVAFSRGAVAAKLTEINSEPGAMLATALSAPEAQRRLARLHERLQCEDTFVGCLNSPISTTITGSEVQIDALKQELDDDGLFARKLQVNVAYHSPHMQKVADEYRDSLAGHLRPSTVEREPTTMISSVTGDVLRASELCKPKYWTDNMTSPVRFAAAVKRAWENSPKLMAQAPCENRAQNNHPILDFLEIGPHAALRSPLKETLRIVQQANEANYYSMLVRPISASQTLLETMGNLHCRGHFVKMSAVNQQEHACQIRKKVLIDLPEYPFDHTRSYWRESRLSRNYRLRAYPPNDFLGVQVPDCNPLERRWRHKIRITDHHWISDHKIDGIILYPAAGMLVMALEAAKQVSDTNRRVTSYSIKDVTFNKTLNIKDSSEGVETQFYLRPSNDTSDEARQWADFRLCVYDNDEWAENARGMICTEYEDAHRYLSRDSELRAEQIYYQQQYQLGQAACTRIYDADKAYKVLKESGLGFGTAFQTLRSVFYNDYGEATAEVKLRQWTMGEDCREQKPQIIHPSALDGILQLPYTALGKGGRAQIPTLVPKRIGRLWISAIDFSDPGKETVKAYARSEFCGFREAVSNIMAMDTLGFERRIIVEDFEKTAVDDNHAGFETMDDVRLCFAVEQKPEVDFLDHSTVLNYCESLCPSVSPPLGFYQDLRLAILIFIFETLGHLNEEHLEHLQPHYLKYIEWMKAQVQMFRSDQLVHSYSDWDKVLRDSTLHEPLFERIENASKTGSFFIRVGRHVSRILSGEMDALDFLFDGTSLYEYYQELNDTTNGMRSFTVYLDALTHKIPGMRILEIGAGTGSATFSILKAIGAQKERPPATSKFTHYDFTDVSPSFFEEAQAKFSDYKASMSFNILDIERDPLHQGYNEESFDLVIAGNVLHATRNLAEALRNTRKLLKTGGRLMLAEVTEPSAMRTGFAFGLLPGWWHSAEDYRCRGPCVSESKWHELLRENGFSGIDFAFPDYNDRECHEHSIMVSTAVDAKPLYESISGGVEINIVVSEASTYQQGIALRLQERIVSDGVKVAPANILSPSRVALASNLDQSYCISLLELEESYLSRMDERAFEAVRTLFTRSKGILWLTRGGGPTPQLPEHGIVSGLIRALRIENNKLKLAVLHLEPQRSAALAEMSPIIKIFKTLLTEGNDYEMEYMESEGRLCIDRLVEESELNTQIVLKTSPTRRQILPFSGGDPLILHIGTPGLLDTLEFKMEEESCKDLQRDEIIIEVRASGVNFKDCLIALGRVPGTKMGFECSGTVQAIGSECSAFKPGDRVCASTTGTFQSLVRCKEVYAMPIPEALSFVEAAALPVAFFTAYYALRIKAQMRDGESILIHSGAGSTGQAAIQLAKLFGAGEIFVTVGSTPKKTMVMELFDIPEDHVFSSRNTSFADNILRMTNQKGVDIVLNSLSGQNLVGSWECIAPFGRFLEIGKQDILSRNSLPMAPFVNNVSFMSIDLSLVLQERPSLFEEVKDGVMSLMFDKKIRPAHPLHVFGVSEIENAFRYLQGGKNTGKSVIEMSGQGLVKTVQNNKQAYSFTASATYLISGGLGGIGRSITHWMVARGAKNIILLSRAGPKTEAAREMIDIMKSQDIRIETPACDISDEQALDSVLTKAAVSMPPIKGCIQSSMVLKDTLFERMSHDEWRTSLQPKVQGSWNLHKLLPAGMDFFIMLSSIAGAIGSATQANYAAGNTFQDALARHRVGLGEKATSLDLGIMIDDGVLAENEAVRKTFSSSGYFKEISRVQLYALLDIYCDSSLNVCSPRDSQIVLGIENPATMKAKGQDWPVWMSWPRCSHLHTIKDGVINKTDNTQRSVDYSAMLANVDSLSEAKAIISDAVMLKLGRVLSISKEDFEESKPLHSYGVDSLVAVELKNWFMKEMCSDIAALELLSSASLSDVSSIVASRSQYVLAAVKEETSAQVY